MFCICDLFAGVDSECILSPSKWHSWWYHMVCPDLANVDVVHGIIWKCLVARLHIHLLFSFFLSFRDVVQSKLENLGQVWFCSVFLLFSGYCLDEKWGICLLQMLDGHEKSLEVSVKSSPAKQKTLDSFVKRCNTLNLEQQSKPKHPRHWFCKIDGMRWQPEQKSTNQFDRWYYLVCGHIFLCPNVCSDVAIPKVHCTGLLCLIYGKMWEN